MSPKRQRERRPAEERADAHAAVAAVARRLRGAVFLDVVDLVTIGVDHHVAGEVLAEVHRRLVHRKVTVGGRSFTTKSWATVDGHRVRQRRREP